MMDRRDFLLTAAGGVGALALPSIGLAERKSGQADPSKMNMIFIAVEDWSTAGVGCYDNSIVKTPNLDAFARTGVRFARAYCQAPVCNPSRSSFCTGLRPDTTGVYGNEDPMSEKLPPDAVSIAELLKRKGAFTASLGKLYHYTHCARKQLRAFDRIEISKVPEGYKGISKGYKLPPGTPPQPKRDFKYTPDPVIDAKLKKLWEERKELEKKYPLGTPNRWFKVYRPFQQLYAEMTGACAEIEEHTYDGKIARCSAEMIREFAADGRQFLLCVGLHAPHTPLVSPKKYADMYDPAKMPMPAALPDQDRNIPAVAKRNGQNFDIFNQFEQTPEKIRAALAGYYGCSSFVDAQIGIVLNALDEAGIADNTIVVVFSDHGFHLGEHGCWSKFTLFEQSTRVPLIVRVPGARANGQVCDEIVELVDVLPTLADLWNIEAPKNLEGVSFAPLLDDPAKPWKKAAFSTITLGGLGRSVRTKRYKYAEYTRKDEDKPHAIELYDLKIDPWEQNNVAGDPKYAGKVAELSKLLATGWKAALPPS
jgi:uncharacterized sulfatase